MLACLSLAMCVGLCFIADLAYVEYNHHHGKTTLSFGDNNAMSSTSLGGCDMAEHHLEI